MVWCIVVQATCVLSARNENTDTLDQIIFKGERLFVINLQWLKLTCIDQTCTSPPCGQRPRRRRATCGPRTTLGRHRQDSKTEGEYEWLYLLISMIMTTCRCARYVRGLLSNTATGYGVCRTYCWRLTPASRRVPSKASRGLRASHDLAVKVCKVATIYSVTVTIGSMKDILYFTRTCACNWTLHSVQDCLGSAHWLVSTVLS